MHVLNDGARVVLTESAVHVEDAEGRLLVRYTDGTAEIASSGDLHLNVPHGRLRMSARDGVELHTSLVRMVVERMHIDAEEILEKSEDVIREVRGRLLTKAERLRTLVSGAARFAARRTEIRSEEETAIDGERVLLG